MDEREPRPEQASEDLSTEAVMEVMQRLSAEGRIDFTEEDKEHVAEMEPDEAISYLMFALAETGEDPEAFLLENNLLLWVESDKEAGNS
jgi:hypothetical protein